MSDRMADFLIKLAEDVSARAAFETAPEAQIARHGLSPDEAAAILSGDDARIIALAAKRAPLVGKILGGMNDEPEEPTVGKILGGFDDEQAPHRLAKCA